MFDCVLKDFLANLVAFVFACLFGVTIVCNFIMNLSKKILRSELPFSWEGTCRRPSRWSKNIVLEALSEGKQSGTKNREDARKKAAVECTV